ncbi:c-type cytochrome [Chelativorans sp. ZYF759]|uniref:c-type cytochrome n=1 Tax=Chelativorans sp. ZYF759 TaxID=2692213 RepID=UPI00145D3DDD|nr:cytochrome c [Chelativorans sp. ZYF759]NMG39569.1 c-type cytochrome [Chelativorans sp. ZYF759]
MPSTSSKDGPQRLALPAALLLALASSPAVAQPPPADVELGRAIAEEHCASCHAIGLEDESPMADVPEFRTLHENYPVTHLAEALAEGIMVGHPEMPVFVLDPAQIEGFLAYLHTLEQPE